MAEKLGERVPIPPKRLEQPNVVELGTGKVIHRIHKREYQGNHFNPCKGGKTRFAPLYDQNQNCIPTLYAADTVEAAIFETILHDVPLESDFKTIPLNIRQLYQHTELLLCRSLKVASMRAPDLMKWEVRSTFLIGCAARYYGYTVQWAESIHRQFQELDGLLWTSNLCDPDTALLLFGDRVASSELRVERIRGGTDDSFISEVRSAAQRANIVITM